MTKKEWFPIRDEHHNHPLERLKEPVDGFVVVRKEREPKRQYKVDFAGKWWCSKCGGKVLCVGIAHPIWDGIGLCSGGGECWHEDAPYCPTCEKKPGTVGSITRD